MPQRFAKDPDAVLDYKFDWSRWLTDGETINSQTTTASTGVTVDSSSITDDGTSVTVWLSGGTPGNTYTVQSRITTSAGRTDDRTIQIVAKNK